MGNDVEQLWKNSSIKSRWTGDVGDLDSLIRLFYEKTREMIEDEKQKNNLSNKDVSDNMDKPVLAIIDLNDGSETQLYPTEQELIDAIDPRNYDSLTLQSNCVYDEENIRIVLSKDFNPTLSVCSENKNLGESVFQELSDELDKQKKWWSFIFDYDWMLFVGAIVLGIGVVFYRELSNWSKGFIVSGMILLVADFVKEKWITKFDLCKNNGKTNSAKVFALIAAVATSIIIPIVLHSLGF
ncbi:hypothetical protein OZX67_03880 [Bifidobacterium sp. ESL0728]|uniref:hypothetical protein n=1 Tax=Bifidobacterium sp. ESL0728 TaxID=2983220 RepID=UPI0023F9945C|nr:hypothetical protein [Bifidobacterium sp. ESL0728]WEV59687.1 hypothetical protein OZX67_03880 [Bifidobacterium sp. ESL0728]